MHATLCGHPSVEEPLPDTAVFTIQVDDSIIEIMFAEIYCTAVSYNLAKMCKISTDIVM